MHIVGQMVLRNEADIVGEVISEVLRWVNDLVVLDGASDDGTLGILQDIALGTSRYSQPRKHLHLHSEPDLVDQARGLVNVNHLRRRLMELTAPLEPDWVLSVDADEIYLHGEGICDPLTAILAAEETRANVVRSHVPEFWLTFADLKTGALNEDETVNVQERRCWYSWGHMGTFIWKWNPEHYYPDYPSKRTPELPGLDWRQWQVAGPLMPVCKHYPIRSLRQGLFRAEERLERGGRWQFGKYAQRWIVDECEAGLHYLGDDGVWDTTPNHEQLKRYLAGD